MPEQFTTKRIKVRISDTQLLKRSDEKRHHFRIAIDLSRGDDTLTGMPEWIQDHYTLMQKRSSKSGDNRIMAKLENMALDFFPTSNGRRFFPNITGATLSKFKMTRSDDTDEAVVTLQFSAYFPGRIEVHQWTWDHKGADCWMEFEQQQGTLSMDGAPNGAGTDEPDDDEEDNEDSPAAQTRRRNAKSNKVLAIQ